MSFRKKIYEDNITAEGKLTSLIIQSVKFEYVYHLCMLHCYVYLRYKGKKVKNQE